MKINEVNRLSEFSKEVTKEKMENENYFSNILFIENKNIELTKNLKTPKENINISEKETSDDNKENKNNNIIEIDEINEIRKNINKSNCIFQTSNIIKPNIMNEIKYGIDENGNPMNINEYYKSINNKNISKKQKPIAYIIRDKNNDNILVDLNGNRIMEKNKDGDYEFPFHFKILIKDFDVKHPELRINGERLNQFEKKDEKKNNNNEQEKNEIIKYDLNNEEISLQIDSIETNENTLPKLNDHNNLNFLYKNHIWKKEFMELYKLRYGNHNNYNKKSIINSLKEQKLSILESIDNNKK